MTTDKDQDQTRQNIDSPNQDPNRKVPAPEEGASSEDKPDMAQRKGPATST
ncbi:hypothetical protein [Azospirillum sp. SYSU D00513]|uniref:hypothetical protein n=1 Tax=Azospirillum sp. SYSU D00513 TaxID=2812561 RepID=UPI001A96B136|nr:hypothetical protein [Azospirillum sp. SYSU D00513]